VQALTDTVAGHWPQVLHLAVMAAWGALMSVVAIRQFSWE
jgi:ABC-2 type transport system permease protein